MDLQRTRDYLLSLPRVTETLQWNLLVYWVLDKAVGGKMFATLTPEAGAAHVMSFAAGQARYNEILEVDGVRPAPYLARAYWVAVADWQVFSVRDLHAHLHAAYEHVEGRLPRRVQRLFELPAREYRRAIQNARTMANTRQTRR